MTKKKSTHLLKPLRKTKSSSPEKGSGKAGPRNNSSRDKRVQQIKNDLMKQKEKLLSEAESALGELPGQILFPDMGDQATAEIDRSFMLRLRGREQKLLKKIEQVLENIERGNYGICEVCGCEIEIERLVARPVTSMCIECKTEQEDEEKLRE
ncbi:MAG: TraR/DksA family transcriptional regulator [bacterium]